MCKQAFYNMGFTDAENSCSKVDFQAQKRGFSEDWMAAVNAINLPNSSPFKDPSQIPLPNDPPIQTPTKEQLDEEDEEEEGENPRMAKLAEKIDSHVEMIDVDNLATNTAPKVWNALK